MSRSWTATVHFGPPLRLRHAGTRARPAGACGLSSAPVGMSAVDACAAASRPRVPFIAKAAPGVHARVSPADPLVPCQRARWRRTMPDTRASGGPKGLAKRTGGAILHDVDQVRPLAELRTPWLRGTITPESRCVRAAPEPTGRLGAARQLSRRSPIPRALADRARLTAPFC